MDYIKYKELGKAFAYGMTKELEGVVSEHFGDHGQILYASLAYMVLNGMIDTEALSEMYVVITKALIDGQDSKITIKTVYSIIFKALSFRYKFSDMEELVEQLNHYTIDDFCFAHGRYFYETCHRGAFVMDDVLYYIAEDYEQYTFSSISVDNIPFNEDMDCTDDREILGYNFDEICDYDSKSLKVYLTCNNQLDVYYVYDIKTDTFELKKGRFVALKDERVYFINESRELVYNQGTIQHKIKKLLPNEKVIKKENGLFVRSASIKEGVFYPYMISFDGDTVPVNITLAREIVWDIVKHVADNTEKLIFKHNSGLLVLDKNKSLSISEILSMFSVIPNADKCDNKKQIIFDEILEQLHNYYDAKEDITELLYVLVDVDVRLTKGKGDREFPSEKLYCRFKEIESDSDLELQFKKLVKRADYKKINEFLAPKKEIITDNRERIGSFSWVNGELVMKTAELKDIKIIGNVLVPEKVEGEDGYISYDSIFDRYIVNCNRVIKDGDRLHLKVYFNLVGKTVTYMLLE